jgi:putative endonuclease
VTPTPKRALGDRGELAARQLLEAKGMQWVASNWHCEAGELDLVMLDSDELVIVEVKTRTGDRSGRAEESISRAKSRRLLATAEWFVDAHPEHADHIWRVDLLALTLRADGSILRVSHVVNAIVSG